jgi:hypothetical protein
MRKSAREKCIELSLHPEYTGTVKRDKLLQLRVTEEELASFKKFAEHQGKRMSEILRDYVRLKGKKVGK